MSAPNKISKHVYQLYKHTAKALSHMDTHKRIIHETFYHRHIKHKHVLPVINFSALYQITVMILGFGSETLTLRG